jgi:ketosteroid isomerase-like protein
MLALVLAGSVSASAQQVDLVQRQEEVRLREQAFAKTMADRNVAAFASFLSDEAVFVGGAGVTRGPHDITAAWKRFFDGPQAPFSWRPETIEVLGSGNLALSSGPVLDPQGMQIGTFNSTWRRDADGVWRIVFDKGC